MNHHVLKEGLALARRIPGADRLFVAACRQLDISAAYHTSVGVKVTNQLFKSEMFGFPIFSQSVMEVAPERLKLSIDGLKDRYTLLGIPIPESPHFSLARALRSEEDLRTNIYVERAGAGTLDLRGPRKISTEFLTDLQDCFARQLEALEADASLPIKVFRVGEQFYIADGKHRAAVHFLLRRNLLCQDVTAALCDSFFWWVRRKIGAHPSEYQKHLRFFELADRSLGLNGSERLT